MTLRAKIVGLVVGLLVVVLGGLWLLLSRSWADWSAEAVDRDLLSRAEALRAVIEVKKDGRLELEDEHAPALSDPAHPFLIGGPGGFAPSHGQLEWPRLDGASNEPRLQTIASADGQRWRVVSWRAPLTHDKRAGAVEPLRATIQVAGPAAPYSAVEARFRHGLLLATAGALLVGAAGGAILVHLSLSPLRRLTREIEGIGAASLERRVHAEGLAPELSRLAVAFNELLGRLQAAMQRHREFVSRASHSLRTPVSTILTRAEVALRRDRDAAAYRAALADVASAARGAAGLVDHLLLLTRLDERAGTIRREPVPLAEVAREVERLLATTAAEAGVALELDVPAELVAIAERTAIRELLEALVDNALRYTPRGGRAGIRATRTADGCSVVVWDTGPGIPAREHARLFERFQRGDAAEARGAPGSGLGLSIVKAIADAHGAPISLGSRTGGGLEFAITLPPGNAATMADDPPAPARGRVVT